MPDPESRPADSATDTSEGQDAASTPIDGDAIEDEVRRAAVEYFDRLTDAAGRLSEQAREVYNLSHEYVSEHPRGLIAGAFGVGVLLGILLGRD